jgi:hypothetical protein|tara:strand:- start:1411 stop:1659 length:249 start_codon:yes stop_codon:yes gene_type:complete
MREVKSIKKISDSMQELDQLARSLVKNPEDALLVCAALMAVTRQHYVEELGSEQTSFIFQSVVESFDFMTALEQEFKQHTIH